ncbi:Hypothetical predicted protein [Pelobates cultripes]|uniref:Uncharacterized protein n=1 Tax=Pelobates cultripes TaxID=61616 RepID=A0AAD1SEC2_PELCU|nr:Hypothetical predicted protein [Pelobates cultripes]
MPDKALTGSGDLHKAWRTSEGLHSGWHYYGLRHMDISDSLELNLENGGRSSKPGKRDLLHLLHFHLRVQPGACPYTRDVGHQAAVTEEG